MAEMKISNTLVNDTSTGEIAYVEQLKDRLLKDYINTLETKDKNRIPTDIKAEAGVFQERLNEFFIKHWVDFQAFLLDEGVDPAVIDSWAEVQEFLKGLPDDEAMWLKDKLAALNNRITAMDIPDGGAYDVSADHVDGGGVYARYGSLSAAIADIAFEDRKSGMYIRYIDSTTDKYKFYHYKLEYADTTEGNNAFATESNWASENLDESPVEDSKNLVTSGAVYDAIASSVKTAQQYVGDNALKYTTEQPLTSTQKDTALNNLGIEGIDDAPTSGNTTHLITSDAVHTAIDNVAFSTNEKVNTVGIDETPTEGSQNLVTSGGVKKITMDIIGNVLSEKELSVSSATTATGISLQQSVKYIIYVISSAYNETGGTGLYLRVGSTYNKIASPKSKFIKGFYFEYIPNQSGDLYITVGAAGNAKIKVWIDELPATIKQLKDSNDAISSVIAEAEVLQTKEKVDVLNIVRCPNILDVSKAVASSYGGAYKQIDVEVEGGETYKFYGVYDVSEYDANNSLIIKHKDNNNKWPYYTLDEDTRIIKVHYKSDDFPKPTAIKGVFVGLDDEYGYKEVTSTPEFIKQSNNLLGDAQSKFAYGYIYVDGVLTFYSASARAWDYVKVEEQKSYKYAFDVSSYNAATVDFYDENKTYISSYVQGYSSTYVFITPALTKYIRVSAINKANELYVCEFTELETPEDSDTIYLSSSIRLLPDVIISPLNNKIWNVMGDSISDLGTGALASEKYYKLIQLKTKCYLRNYGIGSTAITGTSENAMCNRYVNMDDNADYITVFGGTNDFGKRLPIGQWGDSDNTTFYGGMKIICEGLINKYIGKKIGFILPLPRYTGGTSTPPVDYSYPNPGLTEYVEAMKDVLKRYSIPYLDLYTESNLAPKLEAVRTAMMPDGLHPNALGHQMIAEKILHFLERL